MTAATRADAVPRRESPFAGTWPLFRFALRRDRTWTIAWSLGVGLLTYSSVVAVEGAYPDEAARAGRFALGENPATVVMTGPLFGGPTPGIGAIATNELYQFVLISIAVMSIIAMVRHTRRDEELGRTELVRALPVGRFAVPTAGIGAVALTNVLVGLATALGLVAGGFEAIDSLALGAAFTVTGVFFAAVAAVAAQLSRSASGATGLAIGVLGVSFLVRAAGDVADPREGSWLSWLSPMAWGQQMRHFAELRWWPLIVPAVGALLAFAASAALARRREFGAGLLPERLGPGTGSGALTSSPGLAWRLLRWLCAGWGVGIVALAVTMGSLVYALEDMVRDNPAILQWIGTADDLVAGFMALLLVFVVVGVLAFAVSAVLRLWGEEQQGRVESMLATGATRAGLLGSWVAVVGAMVLAVLVAGALGLGGAAAAVTGDAHWVGDVVLAAIGYLPALLVGVGLAVALLGCAPRLAWVAWVLVGWVSLVAFLGELLDLPGWAVRLSPLGATPEFLVSAEQGDAVALALLTTVGVLLLAAGFAGFRRRGIPG